MATPSDPGAQQPTSFLDKHTARILVAAVNDRQNILISGLASTGKTTLLKELLTIVPTASHIGMIENEYEDLVPDPPPLHHRAFRPGVGWQPGMEVTVDDLILEALAAGVDVLALSCITGPVVAVLLQAAQAGTQILTTIAADSAAGALERLQLNAALALPDATDEDLEELIQRGTDLIVHVGRRDQTDTGTPTHQVVEILAVPDPGHDQPDIHPLFHRIDTEQQQ